MNTSATSWAGHDAAARRLGFSVGELDGQFDAMLLVCAITVTAALSFMHPTAIGDAWLLALLALLAAKWSAQATWGAAGGLRVLHQAPGAAARQWLWGWAQHQGRVGCALGAAGYTVVAWHDGWDGRAWCVAGMVWLAQGLAAWCGLAWRRQAHAVWLLWPLLGAAWAWHAATWQQWTMAQPAGLWIAVGAGLLLLGVGLLLGARRRLQQVLAHQGALPLLRRDALGWMGRHGRAWAACLTPATLTGTPWWEGSQSLLIWSVLWMPWGPGSHWDAPLGLLTAWGLLLWTLVLALVLRTRRVHWRRALAPGARLRPRLGQHLLAWALAVQACALAMTVAAGLLWHWAWGHSVTAHWTEVWQAWPAAFELLLATSMGVVLAGWTQRLAARWIVNMLLLLLVAGLAWGLIAAYLQRPELVWGRVGSGYLAALIGLSAALWPLCNRAWAKVDLHALMRSSAQTSAGQAA